MVRRQSSSPLFYRRHLQAGAGACTFHGELWSSGHLRSTGIEARVLAAPQEETTARRRRIVVVCTAACARAPPSTIRGGVTDSAGLFAAQVMPIEFPGSNSRSKEPKMVRRRAGR